MELLATLGVSLLPGVEGAVVQQEELPRLVLQTRFEHLLLHHALHDLVYKQGGWVIKQIDKGGQGFGSTY